MANAGYTVRAEGRKHARKRDAFATDVLPSFGQSRAVGSPYTATCDSVLSSSAVVVSRPKGGNTTDATQKDNATKKRALHLEHSHNFKDENLTDFYCPRDLSTAAARTCTENVSPARPSAAESALAKQNSVLSAFKSYFRSNVSRTGIDDCNFQRHHEGVALPMFIKDAKHTRSCDGDDSYQRPMRPQAYTRQDGASVRQFGSGSTRTKPSADPQQLSNAGQFASENARACARATAARGAHYSGSSFMPDPRRSVKQPTAVQSNRHPHYKGVKEKARRRHETLKLPEEKRLHSSSDFGPTDSARSDALPLRDLVRRRGSYTAEATFMNHRFVADPRSKIHDSSPAKAQRQRMYKGDPHRSFEMNKPKKIETGKIILRKESQGPQARFAVFASRPQREGQRQNKPIDTKRLRDASNVEGQQIRSELSTQSSCRLPAPTPQHVLSLGQDYSFCHPTDDGPPRRGKAFETFRRSILRNTNMAQHTEVFAGGPFENSSAPLTTRFMNAVTKSILTQHTKAAIRNSRFVLPAHNEATVGIGAETHENALERNRLPWVSEIPMVPVSALHFEKSKHVFSPSLRSKSGTADHETYTGSSLKEVDAVPLLSERVMLMAEASQQHSPIQQTLSDRSSGNPPTSGASLSQGLNPTVLEAYSRPLNRRSEHYSSNRGTRIENQVNTQVFPQDNFEMPKSRFIEVKPETAKGFNSQLRPVARNDLDHNNIKEHSREQVLPHELFQSSDELLSQELSQLSLQKSSRKTTASQTRDGTEAVKHHQPSSVQSASAITFMPYTVAPDTPPVSSSTQQHLFADQSLDIPGSHDAASPLPKSRRASPRDFIKERLNKYLWNHKSAKVTKVDKRRHEGTSGKGVSANFRELQGTDENSLEDKNRERHNDDQNSKTRLSSGSQEVASAAFGRFNSNMSIAISPPCGRLDLTPPAKESRTGAHSVSLCSDATRDSGILRDIFAGSAGDGTAGTPPVSPNVSPSMSNCIKTSHSTSTEDVVRPPAKGISFGSKDSVSTDAAEIDDLNSEYDEESEIFYGNTKIGKLPPLLGCTPENPDLSKCQGGPEKLSGNGICGKTGETERVRDMAFDPEKTSDEGTKGTASDGLDDIRQNKPARKLKLKRCRSSFEKRRQRRRSRSMAFPKSDRRHSDGGRSSTVQDAPLQSTLEYNTRVQSFAELTARRRRRRSAVYKPHQNRHPRCPIKSIPAGAALSRFTGSPPSPRFMFSVAELRGIVYLFGGTTADYTGDIQLYALVAPENDSSTYVDRVAHRWPHWCNCCYGGVLGDMNPILPMACMCLLSESASWTWNVVNTQSSMSVPACRTGHTLTAVPSLECLILFGGQTLGGASADLWRFTPKQHATNHSIDESRRLAGGRTNAPDISGTWLRLIALPGPSPPPRLGHTTICFDEVLYIFGGWAAYSATAVVDPASTSIIKWGPSMLPTARGRPIENRRRTQRGSDIRRKPGTKEQIAEKYEDSVGSFEDGRYLSDLWQFDINSRRWTCLSGGVNEIADQSTGEIDVSFRRALLNRRNTPVELISGTPRSTFSRSFSNSTKKSTCQMSCSRQKLSHRESRLRNRVLRGKTRAVQIAADAAEPMVTAGCSTVEQPLRKQHPFMSTSAVHGTSRASHRTSSASTKNLAEWQPYLTDDVAPFPKMSSAHKSEIDRAEYHGPRLEEEVPQAAAEPQLDLVPTNDSLAILDLVPNYPPEPQEASSVRTHGPVKKLGSLEARPKGRWLHSTTVWNGNLYLFGGLSESGTRLDLWEFDLRTIRWRELRIAGVSDTTTISEHIWWPLNCLVGNRWFISPSISIYLPTACLRMTLNPWQRQERYFRKAERLGSKSGEDVNRQKSRNSFNLFQKTCFSQRYGGKAYRRARYAMSLGRNVRATCAHACKSTMLGSCATAEKQIAAAFKGQHFHYVPRVPALLLPVLDQTSESENTAGSKSEDGCFSASDSNETLDRQFSNLSDHNATREAAVKHQRDDLMLQASPPEGTRNVILPRRRVSLKWRDSFSPVASSTPVTFLRLRCTAEAPCMGSSPAAQDRSPKYVLQRSRQNGFSYRHSKTLKSTGNCRQMHLLAANRNKTRMPAARGYSTSRAQYGSRLRQIARTPLFRKHTKNGRVCANGDIHITQNVPGVPVVFSKHEGKLRGEWAQYARLLRPCPVSTPTTSAAELHSWSYRQGLTPPKQSLGKNNVGSSGPLKPKNGFLSKAPRRRSASFESFPPSKLNASSRPCSFNTPKTPEAVLHSIDSWSNQRDLTPPKQSFRKKSVAFSCSVSTPKTSVGNGWFGNPQSNRQGKQSLRKRSVTFGGTLSTKISSKAQVVSPKNSLLPEIDASSESGNLVSRESSVSDNSSSSLFHSMGNKIARFRIIQEEERARQTAPFTWAPSRPADYLEDRSGIYVRNRHTSVYQHGLPFINHRRRPVTMDTAYLSQHADGKAPTWQSPQDPASSLAGESTCRTSSASFSYSQRDDRGSSAKFMEPSSKASKYSVPSVPRLSLDKRLLGDGAVSSDRYSSEAPVMGSARPSSNEKVLARCNNTLSSEDKSEETRPKFPAEISQSILSSDHRKSTPSSSQLHLDIAAQKHSRDSHAFSPTQTSNSSKELRTDASPKCSDERNVRRGSLIDNSTAGRRISFARLQVTFREAAADADTIDSLRQGSVPSALSSRDSSGPNKLSMLPHESLSGENESCNQRLMKQPQCQDNLAAHIEDFKKQVVSLLRGKCGMEQETNKESAKPKRLHLCKAPEASHVGSQEYPRGIPSAIRTQDEHSTSLDTAPPSDVALDESGTDSETGSVDHVSSDDSLLVVPLRRPPLKIRGKKRQLQTDSAPPKKSKSLEFKASLCGPFEMTGFTPIKPIYSQHVKKLKKQFQRDRKRHMRWLYTVNDDGRYYDRARLELIFTTSPCAIQECMDTWLNHTWEATRNASDVATLQCAAQRNNARQAHFAALLLRCLTPEPTGGRTTFPNDFRHVAAAVQPDVSSQVLMNAAIRSMLRRQLDPASAYPHPLSCGWHEPLEWFCRNAKKVSCVLEKVNQEFSEKARDQAVGFQLSDAQDRTGTHDGSFARRSSRQRTAMRQFLRQDFASNARRTKLNKIYARPESDRPLSSMDTRQQNTCFVPGILGGLGADTPHPLVAAILVPLRGPTEGVCMLCVGCGGLSRFEVRAFEVKSSSWKPGAEADLVQAAVLKESFAGALPAMRPRLHPRIVRREQSLYSSFGESFEAHIKLAKPLKSYSAYVETYAAEPNAMHEFTEEAKRGQLIQDSPRPPRKTSASAGNQETASPRLSTRRTMNTGRYIRGSVIEGLSLETPEMMARTHHPVPEGENESDASGALLGSDFNIERLQQLWARERSVESNGTAEPPPESNCEQKRAGGQDDSPSLPLPAQSSFTSETGSAATQSSPSRSGPCEPITAEKSENENCQSAKNPTVTPSLKTKASIFRRCGGAFMRTKSSKTSHSPIPRVGGANGCDEGSSITAVKSNARQRFWALISPRHAKQAALLNSGKALKNSFVSVKSRSLVSNHEDSTERRFAINEVVKVKPAGGSSSSIPESVSRKSTFTQKPSEGSGVASESAAQKIKSDKSPRASQRTAGLRDSVHGSLTHMESKESYDYSNYGMKTTVEEATAVDAAVPVTRNISEEKHEFPVEPQADDACGDKPDLQNSLNSYRSYRRRKQMNPSMTVSPIQRPRQQGRRRSTLQATADLFRQYVGTGNSWFHQQKEPGGQCEPHRQPLYRRRRSTTGPQMRCVRKPSSIKEQKRLKSRVGFGPNTVIGSFPNQRDDEQSSGSSGSNNNSRRGSSPESAEDHRTQLEEITHSRRIRHSIRSDTALTKLSRQNTPPTSLKMLGSTGKRSTPETLFRAPSQKPSSFLNDGIDGASAKNESCQTDEYGRSLRRKTAATRTIRSQNPEHNFANNFLHSQDGIDTQENFQSPYSNVGSPTLYQLNSTSANWAEPMISKHRKSHLLNGANRSIGPLVTESFLQQRLQHSRTSDSTGSSSTVLLVNETPVFHHKY